jgi:hypothetical protein
VRHFGTPKFIFLLGAIIRVQNWRGNLKRKNAAPNSPVVACASQLQLRCSKVHARAASSTEFCAEHWDES